MHLFQWETNSEHMYIYYYSKQKIAYSSPGQNKNKTSCEAYYS